MNRRFTEIGRRSQNCSCARHTSRTPSAWSPFRACLGLPAWRSCGPQSSCRSRAPCGAPRPAAASGCCSPWPAAASASCGGCPSSAASADSWALRGPTADTRRDDPMRHHAAKPEARRAHAARRGIAREACCGARQRVAPLGARQRGAPRGARTLGARPALPSAHTANATGMPWARSFRGDAHRRPSHDPRECAVLLSSWRNQKGRKAPGAGLPPAAGVSRCQKGAREGSPQRRRK